MAWFSPIECAAQRCFQSMPRVCTMKTQHVENITKKSAHSSVKSAARRPRKSMQADLHAARSPYVLIMCSLPVVLFAMLCSSFFYCIFICTNPNKRASMQFQLHNLKAIQSLTRLLPNFEAHDVTPQHDTKQASPNPATLERLGSTSCESLVRGCTVY